MKFYSHHLACQHIMKAKLKMLETNYQSEEVAHFFSMYYCAFFTFISLRGNIHVLGSRVSLPVRCPFDYRCTKMWNPEIGNSFALGASESTRFQYLPIPCCKIKLTWLIKYHSIGVCSMLRVHSMPGFYFHPGSVLGIYGTSF